jgi:hypothetical protein
MPGTATGAFDRPSYRQGDPVTVTFTAEGEPYDVETTRAATFKGAWDDAPDQPVVLQLSTSVMVQTPNRLTIHEGSWDDTGAPFVINGLQATGTA